MPTTKPCKDCVAEGVTTNRPAPHPGPRCVTHHRAKRKRDKERAHGRHVEQTYGITAEEYRTLYNAQGGACYICGKAKGISKRLAVDHDHETGAVRCLACTTCNRIVLGRYTPQMLYRAIVVLTNPPAQRMLNG